jgi:hypothetical protein
MRNAAQGTRHKGQGTRNKKQGRFKVQGVKKIHDLKGERNKSGILKNNFFELNFVNFRKAAV